MDSAMLSPAPARSRRTEAGVVGFTLVLAALAWAVTDGRMAGMDAGPGTDLGGVGWFLGIWVTMMAAMMLPSLVPVVVAYTRIDQRRPAGATALFGGGYLAAWAAAGLLAYTVIQGVRSLDPGFLGWDEQGRYVAGAVILGAALYQLTSFKDRCLRECRRPGMLLAHRRRGHRGALEMGLEHGAFCVGCCWALMAALFALGMMSVGWMFVVAALIAAEKLSPWRALANRGVAVVLAALALAVAFTPHDVPGLTVPGSSDAMSATMTG
jgi:predicted metal-binding membrane protein